MNVNKVPGGDQVYGAVMKLYEKQGKKDKVLEMYERCKKEGIKASGAIYEAYINATIGYKPAKYRKKK
jgi:pentatricopeptide repeat protein